MADADATAATYLVRARCAGRPIVVDGVLPEVVDQLRSIILTQWLTSTTTPTLAVGAWKSPEEFLSWQSEPIRALRGAIRREIGGDVEPTGWAMVGRRGARHPRHHHAWAIVSGVYYVDPGDRPAPTIFEVPGQADVEVEAVVARLVLFPSQLWHRVDPYAGDRPRVTVAFDIRR